MSWYNHPAYCPIRDKLIARFKARSVAFRRLKHVVFLCGGANSEPRDSLLRYLEKCVEDTLVFRADDVWAQIASTDRNALEMEAYLADLADVVIVIVESPGTFAELGAFSNSSGLRRKLLLILDVQYCDAPSFINTGPVRWTNADSMFRPALFVRLPSILSAAPQILERLQRLPPCKAQSIDKLVEHPKHLLFFLRDIVAVVGPVTAPHIKRYVHAILDEAPPQLVSLLSLAEALNLVEATTMGLERYYFVRMSAEFKPVVKKRFFELADERAKVLSVLQNIGPAKTALELLSP